VHRDRMRLEPYIAERVVRLGSGTIVEGMYMSKWFERAYHIAYELKRPDKEGDAGGGSRGAIDDAATQVARSLNGLVSFLVENKRIVGPDPDSMIDSSQAILMPVIFTTAELWTTDTDLRTADPLTGQLSEPVTAENVGWLPYQYHLSPGVKHGIRPRRFGDTIGQIMDAEYIRTIAIVSAQGIPAFLQEWSYLEPPSR